MPTPNADIKDRLRELADHIARKPSQYTSAWAATASESFSSYTRTSTINLLCSLNSGLMESDWPFPAYIDLKQVFRPPPFPRISRMFGANFGSFSAFFLLMAYRAIPRGGFFRLMFANYGKQPKPFDGLMLAYLHAGLPSIQRFWLSRSVLTSKTEAVLQMTEAFERKLWTPAACTAFSLLDHVLRDISGTQRLDISMQKVRQAFYEKAGLTPELITPGFTVYDNLKKFPDQDLLFKKLEEDLRLPGIHLASFFHFTDRFYSWCKEADGSEKLKINRHSIMHGACNSVEPHVAGKILLFLDLTLRLEDILRFLISGTPLPTNAGKEP